MKTLLTLFILMSFTAYASAQKTWDRGAGNNNWNDANNWDPNGVPAATDAVTIPNGFTVVLNVTTTIASLTVGGGASGSLTLGNNNTDRTLSITGNIIVSNGATLQTAGNGDNVLNIGGNLQNNGTFDLRIGGATANVIFNGSANQTVTGTGTTTDFNSININNTGAINNNIVDIASTNFSAVAGFLTLTDGVIRMSGSYTFTNTFFNSATPVINADEGIWLNNPNVTVTGQNGDTQLSGLFRITAGTYNIGVTADWWLEYFTGAQIIIEGGTLNISGALIPNTATEAVTYNQSGGTVNTCTVGNTFSVGSFDLSAAGSSFTMSGGFIIFPRPSSVVSDWINNASTFSVTGGTVQFGNASTPSSSIFQATGTTPVFNLTVNNVNTPVFRFTTAINVLGTITNGGTIEVPAFNQNISVAGNWLNNNVFTAGTGTVTFNGSAAQTIGGSSSTTFNNITFNKTSGGITLNRATNVAGTATFTSGIVATTITNMLTMNAGSSVSGGSATSHVSGPMAKVGTTAFTFPVGNGTFYRTIGIGTPSVSSTFRAQFFRANPVSSISPYSLVSGLTVISVCEYWTLDRTAGTGNATVTLSWGTNTGCGATNYVNDRPNLRVARHTGAGGFWNNEGNTLPTGNNAAGTITSTNTISSFGPFSLAAAGTFNPLPVNFVEVTGTLQANSAVISWTNATEENLNRYVVERSVDGRTFEAAGTVQPKANNGSTQSYSFTDVQPANLSYYRIRAVENNGSNKTSSIIKLSRNNSSEKEITVYPNPVINKTVVLQASGLSAGKYAVRLINNSGAVVFANDLQLPTGAFVQTLQLPQGISPGVYLLMIESGTFKKSIKLMIQ